MVPEICGEECSVYETLDERRRFFLPSPWEISICVQATRKSEKPERNEKINLDLFRDASLKSNIRDENVESLSGARTLNTNSKYMFRRERKKNHWNENNNNAASFLDTARNAQHFEHIVGSPDEKKKKLEDLNLVSTLDRMKYFSRLARLEKWCQTR